MYKINQFKSSYYFVKSTVNKFLRGYIDPVEFNNIRIEFFYDDVNFRDSQIYVKKKLNHKWELIDTFCFSKYFNDDFEMITTWWYEDMLKEITECVNKHYETEKQVFDFDFNLYKVQ
jgi:hypothetical protein